MHSVRRIALMNLFFKVQGEVPMTIRHRKIWSVLLAAAIASPVLLTGCAAHRRVYDGYDHAYVQWGVESPYYRQWEDQTHRHHERYEKRSHQEQQEYWQWRHQQQDHGHDHDH